MVDTPQKTNIAPEKMDPKRKVVFQPSIFRCELLVSGSVLSKDLVVQEFATTNLFDNDFFHG